MKAAVYAKARSGRVLRIMDLEQPVPKDNEVLVQVCAASVNPLDAGLMKASHTLFVSSSAFPNHGWDARASM